MIHIPKPYPRQIQVRKGNLNYLYKKAGSYLVWGIILINIVGYFILHLLYPEDTQWITKTISSLGASTTFSGADNAGMSGVLSMMIIGESIMTLILAAIFPQKREYLGVFLLLSGIGGCLAALPTDLHSTLHLLGSILLFGFASLFVMAYFITSIKNKTLVVLCVITTLVFGAIEIASEFFLNDVISGLSERLMFFNLLIWMGVSEYAK